ncbi:MAG: energy transducer TonB [Alphaproteobacteria bacterium]|nr:energy transducer TonB [Alphaproteobacteria bacterium]
MHLLPLLALVTWLRPNLPTPSAIPIQLVIEQPKPEPQPAPAPAKAKQQAPPPGLVASDDFGDVGPTKGPKSPEAEHPQQQKPPSSGSEAPAAAAKAETAAPAEPPSHPAIPTQTASLVAPPPLEPLPELSLPAPSALPPPLPAPPPPKPAAAKRAPLERPPMLTGLTLPLPLYADSANTAGSAQYPGPHASRDEYCAYALSLVLKHIGLLPDSLVGARRGATVLTIRVREDGAIIGAVVTGSSGYSDIDDRVVEMVNAVGKFPRLPMWVPGPAADFTFRLHFPHSPSR